MARRRREQEEKPDLGFEIPEFDEDEFIRKETISFRTTLILFLYSIVTAFVTFLLWLTVTDSWYMALLIAGATGYLLRYIYPALKVDISHFGKKEWTGTGLLYFFSWLAFFIFLTNPPLYDGVAPDLDVHITPDVQTPGSVVDITLVAADNLRVDDDTLTFRVAGPEGEIAGAADLRPHIAAHHVWTWNHTFTQPGIYTVTASVADSGTALFFGQTHTAERETTFEIKPDAITVILSGEDVDGVGHLKATRDAVEVRVPVSLNVYRVWLDKDDGTSMLLAHDRERSNDQLQIYYAEPNFDGFTQGNNTFTVRVEEHDSYWLAAKYGIPGPNTALVSPDTYTVVIDDATLLGDEKAPNPKREATEPRQIPGFETPLVLIGVIAAAALVARSRRQ